MKTAAITIGVALGFITLDAAGFGTLVIGAILGGWLVAKVWKFDSDLSELASTLSEQKALLEQHLAEPPTKT